MIQCPKCSADNSDDSRFCKSCAEPLSSLPHAPTITTPEGGAPQAPVDAPHVGRIVSSDSVPAGGFTPGTVLSDRYRIIGLLGRGGMGEVYRADDLKLGQSVALKFLPPKLSDDPVRRERFFAEVRITRQLSHPNICRVYDIGEVDGRHFLSMEYIDGEDLASLMKRIGHLSNEKALDIARQLVAGLTVAHERGVLHRDLKPANIMLDGHGRVRITDFGLAVAVGDESQAGEIAGTPAYMAPEQLAGKGATVRSDIYSLGLILYEIYTGKKAFTAKTLAELREQKETKTPRALSEIREGIDTVVERVIQRCMEKDPNARPASAAQLAQALPGGDPLAAAIAAGETPSPEMVAASGSKEGLAPWIGWICVTFIILGIGAVIVLSRQASLYMRIPVEMPPEALAQRAQDILKDSGYPGLPADSAYGFNANEAYFHYVEKTNQSPTRFEELPPFVVQFWYRQSPHYLEHLAVSITGESVNLLDPPVKNKGESVVWLDSRGNLVGLLVVPGAERRTPGTTEALDWSALFEAAGLDEKIFTKVEPDWNYLSYSDERVAWIGEMPDLPNVKIRIEATAWNSKPILWRMTIPSWESLSISTPSLDVLHSNIMTRMYKILLPFCTMSVIGVFFARRNLRMGRGDRRGATRLAYFYFALSGIGWLFAEHHIVTSGELVLLLGSIATCLLWAVLIWIFYIALEPFYRRRLPNWLVGWSRLLAGNFRDPLVGRDLLIGCIGGIICVLLNYLRFPLASLFDAPQIRPSAVFMQVMETAGLGRAGTLYLLSGNYAVIASVLSVLAGCILLGFSFSLIYFIIRNLLKYTWAAVIVHLFIATAANTVVLDEPSLFSLVFVILVVGTSLFVLLRYGLLANITCLFFFSLLLSFPITMEFSAWYFKIGLTGLVLLLAFALYAFYISLGGRPIFGTPRLDE